MIKQNLGSTKLERRYDERIASGIAVANKARKKYDRNIRFAQNFYRMYDKVCQDMIDTNFKFYKQITDNPEFGKLFLDWLFDRFRRKFASGR